MGILVPLAPQRGMRSQGILIPLQLPKAAPCPWALDSHPSGSVRCLCPGDTAHLTGAAVLQKNPKSSGVFIPKSERGKRPAGVSMNCREGRIPRNSSSANPVGFASVGWSEMTWTLFIFPVPFWGSWMELQLGRATRSRRFPASGAAGLRRLPLSHVAWKRRDCMDGALRAGWRHPGVGNGSVSGWHRGWGWGWALFVADEDAGVGHPWQGGGDTRMPPGEKGRRHLDSLERWEHPSRGKAEGRRVRMIPARIQDVKRVVGAALGEGLGVHVSWTGPCVLG